MKPGKTRRQQMTDLLQRKSWSVYELAEEFGVKISTILDDLTYKIRKSVSSRYRIQIPPECSNCGFKFKKGLSLRSHLAVPNVKANG